MENQKTKITLKINSFKNGVNVLKNDRVIFDEHTLLDYMDDTPIIEKADDILKDINREWENHELYVYGNLFERELFKFKCKLKDERVGYSSFEPQINISSHKRLALLAKINPSLSKKISFEVDSNTTQITIPDYPLIERIHSDSDNKIIISSNIDYIINKLPYSDEYAFLIGGESQEIDGKYIIGCTSENVNDLVVSYIETKYINPAIGELFKTIEDKIEVNSHYRLINRTEPYFYTEPNFCKGESLVFLDDESADLPIKSISYNCKEKELFIYNGFEEMSQLEIQLSNDNFAKYFLNRDNGRLQLIPKTIGTGEVSIYFEETLPVAKYTFTINESHHISRISATIRGEHHEVGKKYKIDLTYEPEDADDSDQIIIKSSNENVAKVVDNGENFIYIEIKNEGEFELIAETKRIKTTKKYLVEDTVYEIKPLSWPKQVECGDNFRCPITIKPEKFARDGFKFEIKKGNKRCVRIVTKKDGSVSVKARFPGEVHVRFISNTNLSVHCDCKLYIKKKEIEPRCRFFSSITVLVFLAALILLFVRKTDAFWAVGGTGMLFAILSFLRREEDSKYGIIFFSLVFIIASLLRINVFYLVKDVKAYEDLPIKTIEYLQDEATSNVMDEPYEFDSFDISGNESYRATSQKCIGYYFLSAKSNEKKDNILYYIYKVETVNIQDYSSRTVYTAVEYYNFREYKDNEIKYSEGQPYGSETFKELIEELVIDMTDDYNVTSDVSEDTYYKYMGISEYMTSKEQLSDKTLESIVKHFSKEINSVEKNQSDNSVSYSKIKLYDVDWFCEDTIYSKNYNCLTVYLYREVYKDGKTVQTLYYPIKYSNVTLSKSGYADITVSDGVQLDTQTYQPVFN